MNKKINLIENFQFNEEIIQKKFNLKSHDGANCRQSNFSMPEAAIFPVPVPCAT
jgi:hypothetical protein